MGLKAAAAVGGECDAEAPVAKDPLVMTLKFELSSECASIVENIMRTSIGCCEGSREICWKLGLRSDICLGSGSRGRSINLGPWS